MKDYRLLPTIEEQIRNCGSSSSARARGLGRMRSCQAGLPTFRKNQRGAIELIHNHGGVGMYIQEQFGTFHTRQFRKAQRYGASCLSCATTSQFPAAGLIAQKTGRF